MVVSLGFLAPLRFFFTAIVIVVIILYFLPLPRFYTMWSLIKEKPSDDTGVWLDVPASRCECPSHRFSVIQPSCVVCNLLPVLRAKQLSFQDPHCRSARLPLCYRGNHPRLLRRGASVYLPLAPMPHPHPVDMINRHFGFQKCAYLKDIMPRLCRPTGRSTWSDLKSALSGGGVDRFT